MDTAELRAAAEKLQNLHGRFAPCFGRRESQEHSRDYLRGLLLAEGRKSVEPMAMVFGEPAEGGSRIAQSSVLAWQRFLTVSPWKAQDVMQEVQAVFREEFVPSASGWEIGAVGVVDGSGFVKRGPESVGVQRQWCGRLGKKENCQVGVFLLGVTPAGSALLDHQLYLPESWADDPLRREKTRVPAKAWQVIQLREGEKGPLAFEFTRLRVWSVRHRHAGPQVWLSIRRSLEPTPEVKYYVSNAEADVPLKTMALVTGSRWPVEEFFEDAKGQLGMADYEARSWTSWHHHMSLVALAHLYVMQVRHDLKRTTPELTLDMALRLLRAALPRPRLTLPEAGDLVDYYLDRNQQATQSHRKTWLEKHPNLLPTK